MCFGGGGSSKEKKPPAPVAPEVGYQQWMTEGQKARGVTDPGNGATLPGTSIAGDLGNPMPAS
jgi:hypothetical protein